MGVSYSSPSSCAHPVESVLATLDCIVHEDVECALAGYAPTFKKLHNGVDTNTVINKEFWEGAFQLVDLKLDYNHMAQIGRNFISLRYVEEVKTVDASLFGLPGQAPPVETIVQHEHALITVDNQCRMVLFDQYGDNAEQVAVDDAVAELLAYLAPPPPAPPAASTCAQKKIDIKAIELSELIRASWYAQFQKETFFERKEDFQCRTATYDLNPAGVEGAPEGSQALFVNNRLGRPDLDIELTAVVAGPGQLRVAPCEVFNFETAGDFSILDFGANDITGEYEWAVVMSGNPTETAEDGECTTPFGNGLWMYTREKVASEETVQKMFDAIAKQGVSPIGLLPVKQGEECATAYDSLRLKPETTEALTPRRCVPAPVTGLRPCFVPGPGPCDDSIPAPGGSSTGGVPTDSVGRPCGSPFAEC